MYLIKADYRKQIQDVNLQQIISSDDSILDSAQLAAQAESISYLVQKYETDREFTDTNAWNGATVYYTEDRIYLYAEIYNSANSYTIGMVTNSGGVIYICTTNTTGVFDLTKWTILGNLNDIFYVKYPFPKFNLKNYYNIGDKVFWKNKVYTARAQTQSISHESRLQLQSNNVENTNVFPDDARNGPAFWGTGIPYSVTAGTLVTDATKWTKGDNRSQQMVMYLIDITLFHVHTRLTPRNIPQMRIDRYTHAIQWLQMAGQGTITAALPLLQPKQGARIRYGGTIKNINSY